MIFDNEINSLSTMAQKMLYSNYGYLTNYSSSQEAYCFVSECEANQLKSVIPPI